MSTTSRAESALLTGTVFRLRKDGDAHEHQGDPGATESQGTPGALRSYDCASGLVAGGDVIAGRVRCCDGRLYESVARVQGGDTRAEAPFAGVQLSYQRRLVQTPYYDRPDWNDLLDQYRIQLKEGSFLFPTAALRCVEGFRSISDGRLLVLSADRGYHDLRAIEGADEPQLLAHGSFSLPVNYHALGLSTAAHGGQTFFSDRSDGSFVVSASLFGEQAAPWPRTRRALVETLDGFSPGDFFSVKKALERTAGLLDLDHMMAHLRLSHWDSRILDLFLPFLGARLDSASEVQRQAWSDALERVLARHLSIGEDRDLEVTLSQFAAETGLSPKIRRQASGSGGHDIAAQPCAPTTMPATLGLATSEHQFESRQALGVQRE